LSATVIYHFWFVFKTDIRKIKIKAIFVRSRLVRLWATTRFFLLYFLLYEGIGVSSSVTHNIWYFTSAINTSISGCGSEYREENQWTMENHKDSRPCKKKKKKTVESQ
jgi:hypothetical protein